MVLLKDIEMFSTCEHHWLPFFGKAHIAYIPGTKLVGISKLARLLDIFARRLQIQERIGDQVTTAIMELLEPKGAACIIEAQHFCMKARGVEKQNSIMVTSSMKGVFLSKPEAKQELLSLIK
jgi:GTP cyclohydrolase I